jgi:AcrR family transcriptional regulator
MPELPSPTEPPHPIASRRGQPRTPEDQARDRAALVKAALELLESEGPNALSMRRLATQIGSSYQVVYTLFGGKTGLLDALFREGFLRLARACEITDASDGEDGDEAKTGPLVACAVAYRRFALAHRELYALMFGQAISGFAPDAESRRIAREAFGVVRRAARSALGASGSGTTHPPAHAVEALARAGWASTHGHVALELDSWFGPDPDAEARLVESLRTLVAGANERATSD